MSVLHVVPLDDVLDHFIPGGLGDHGLGCIDCKTHSWIAIEADEHAPGGNVSCSCQPEVEFAQVPGDGDWWMVKHHRIGPDVLAELAVPPL